MKSWLVAIGRPIVTTLPDRSTTSLRCCASASAVRCPGLAPEAELAPAIVSEGLEAAIMAWTAVELGFEPPVVRVAFDGAANRYRFDFG